MLWPRHERNTFGAVPQSQSIIFRAFATFTPGFIDVTRLSRENAALLSQMTD